jgi:serine/threonine-protein kinase
MPLEPGTRVGPYEIRERIGVGGMGEVYRARDTRLHRDVAVKIVSGAFAEDADHRARFRREAELLASLNHPNVAHVYGLEEAVASSGASAIVMELVLGSTLADRLASGPLPVDEALKVARQIAAALEAAHSQGIVHRDLKPANVKVRNDGAVKVLDFGLAKAVETARGSGPFNPAQGSGLTAQADLTNSPTVTQQGIVLGTAAYMSPEQARGKLTDKRVDIWAFGCVLYELLSGRRAFAGADMAETIAAVMRGEPDWAALPASTPTTIQMFLRRCLEKDPADRVHDIADVRLALGGAFDPPAGAAIRPARLRRSRLVAMAVGAIALAAAVGAIAWTFKPATPPSAVRRFRVTTAPAVLAIANTNRDIAVTPAGTAVVYFAGQGADRQMYVRQLDAIDGTTLRQADRFFEPFVSPDGRWVAFIDETDLTLRKVPLAGGPPVTIARVGREMLGGTWGADDTIVFAMNETGSGLRRVPAAGGTPTTLTTPRQDEGEVMHSWPVFLPGGRTVLYTVRSGALANEFRIDALDVATGERKVIIRNATNPRYSPSGHLVFAIENSLRAVRFDPSRLEVSGDPVPVVDGVLTKASGGASFDLASDGTLAYVSGSNYIPRRLVWVDRAGRREAIAAPLRGYIVARLSPDGTRAALDVRDQQSDIWIWDFAREALTRVTSDPAVDSNPVWLPDGRTIVYTSARTGVQVIFSQNADGGGLATQLTNGPNPQISRSVSRDGSRLFFDEYGTNRSEDLMSLEMAPPRRVLPLLQTPANERNGEISPDGRWIAYSSDESGRHEIYVRPHPNLEARRWQISVDGGAQPAFSRRGDEIFFLGRAGRMMVSQIRTSGEFSASPPRTLLDPQYYAQESAVNAIITARGYDISPDGRRFLMIESAEAPVNAAGIVVVLNWTEELKRALPAR